MYLIRDIMYCQPGKARPMVEKFKALGTLIHKLGFARLRVMTDVSAERYWTVVAEFEVEDLGVYTQQSRKSMEMPEFQAAMKGYHDLIASGRREIYMIET